MRYAELLFLALLVLYHAVLLLPRHRRPFPANYLVFLAGMALAWNLGLEGLRWQTIPPVVLLLLDFLVLFPTFATLRGSFPTPGFVSGLFASLRLLVVFAALLIALGSSLLSIAFPLPQVELTGGIQPSLRVVRFPATGDRPGLEVSIWYPAGGDMAKQPRPQAEPEAWKISRAAGGLPVFWQSYLANLPTPAVLGGKLAAPQTKYPVIYAVLPAKQPASDFAYLYEDLASRGFVVAAGTALAPPSEPEPPFEWSAAWAEISRPFVQPTLWLEPEAAFAATRLPDYSLLAVTQKAVRQLSLEPGDLLFGSVDWTRQGLWSWGEGPEPASLLKSLDIRAAVRTGAVPKGTLNMPELWISADKPAGAGPEGRWILTVPGLKRADLADAAYLKPYLAFFGLKTQADAGVHGAIRQYQAAFFQHVFWNTGPSAAFGQTVPALPGLTLSGH